MRSRTRRGCAPDAGRAAVTPAATSQQGTPARRNQSGSFAVVGDAWLGAGATAFEVYVNDSCVWRTGAATADGPENVLECRKSLGPSGWLDVRVRGISGESAERRLAADAELLAEAMRLDGDLEQMIGELIDAQDQLLALYDLANATRRQLSLDAVLTELVAEVQRLTNAELAFAALTDSAGGRLVVYPAERDEHQATLWRAFERARSTQTPLVASTAMDLPLGLEAAASLRNLVVVPVSVDAQPQAALGVVNQRDTTFSAGTVKLLQALGEQAGALLENALMHEHALAQERLRRDMELAAEIQAGLMAETPPSVAGVEVAARFRPAADVGGDFYDYQLRADGKLIVSVGDVSGKGLSAALVMGVSRTALRGTSQLLRGPAEAMHLANTFLYRDLDRVGTFVTAFIGYYDPARQLVRFASAGHSPVIYCAAGELPTMLPATGLPLGVLPESRCFEESVRMAAGDLLVVGTDGFSEAADSAGTLFGDERLLTAIKELASQSATSIADGLFATVANFVDGAVQADDQTLLVVKGC
jgi:serine phosphatase RsbU (regulator of sigma subunit)